MYLIWRMDTTAKGAKKNTSPNVIHLQYTWQCDREAGLGTAPGVGQTRPPTCSPPPHWPSSGPPQAAYTCTPHLTTELKKIVLYNITVQQLFSWSHCQSIF